MARKKKIKNGSLFNQSKEDKIAECIRCLQENGYGIFKLDGANDSEIKEEEMIQQLTALGHKIVRFEEDLTKVDVRLIKSSDEIVVYFYEMLKRNHPNLDPTTVPNSYAARKAGRSIVNSYISYRIQNAKLSYKSSLEELFQLINVLFDVAPRWGITIEGIGILSVNYNLKFIKSVLKELHRREDFDLQYKIDKKLQEKAYEDYETNIDQRIKELKALSGKPRRGRPRKIKTRGDNNGT